jgi:hypothetical protein
MENQRVLELKHEFAKLKKELEIEFTYEEMEPIFFLEDMAYLSGIYPKFSRQLCHRIQETLSSWSNHIHSLIVPNPAHIMNISESQMLSDEEKIEMEKLIIKIAGIIRINTLAGLTHDKAKEKEFIEKSVKLWNNELKPLALDLTKRTIEKWENPAPKTNKKY